jgi:hypothetical protein
LINTLTIAASGYSVLYGAGISTGTTVVYIVLKIDTITIAKSKPCCAGNWGATAIGTAIAG